MADIKIGDWVILTDEYFMLVPNSNIVGIIESLSEFTFCGITHSYIDFKHPTSEWYFSHVESRVRKMEEDEIVEWMLKNG